MLVFTTGWAILFVAYQCLNLHLKERREQKWKEQRAADDRRRQMIVEEEYRRGLYDFGIMRMQVTAWATRKTKTAPEEAVDWKQDGF